MRPIRDHLPWLCGLALAACTTGKPGAFPPPDPALVARNQGAGDPYGGRFPHHEAVAGLPEEGSLHAVLLTSEGEIDCRLEPATAPLTVANFVGLARGLRPFQAGEGGPWVREPYYDDLPFHRAEEGQFIQVGRRGPRESAGFFIQDETGVGDTFDRAGTLAMANAGPPNTGSAQFFVTTGKAEHLEGEHTIFGSCDGEAVARRIERQLLDNPHDPPVLRTVRIERR